MADEIASAPLTQSSPCESQFQDTWNDIQIMMDYARAEGKVVPASIRDRIGNLCYPDQPSDATAPIPNAIPNAAVMRTRIGEALDVHGALCQLIAPVTPVTIRASKTNGRLWADNITVRILLVLSAVSLVAFLFTAISKGVKGFSYEAATGYTAGSAIAPNTNNAASNRPSEKPKGDTSGNTGSGIDYIMVFAAAMLGSGFYGLYTAHKYIVDCTFDPKYNQIYVVRYVLGLMSGTILGCFGTSMFHPSSPTDPKQLGPPVLALIGGYAAEAVSQILQRIADTLITIVRGSNDDSVSAKKSELEAKNKQQEAQKKMDMLKPLQEAKEAMMAQGAGVQPQAHAAIQRAIDSLMKS